MAGRHSGRSWIGFTEIVLALSGVEAIANMTGIMVQPVEKTARKAILPVLIEIVILNLILALAMTSLPDSILYEPATGHRPAADGQWQPSAGTHRRHAQGDRRSHYVGVGFAAVASIVFAALLLSAVNTALADAGLDPVHALARQGTAARPLEAQPVRDAR